MKVKCEYCRAVFDESELLRDYDLRTHKREKGAEYCPYCLMAGYIVENR